MIPYASWKTSDLDTVFAGLFVRITSINVSLATRCYSRRFVNHLFKTEYVKDIFKIFTVGRD